VFHYVFVRSYVCTIAWKGHPRNDLYCVGRDVKPYSLTHSLTYLCNFVLLADQQKESKTVAVLMSWQKSSKLEYIVCNVSIADLYSYWSRYATA